MYVASDTSPPKSYKGKPAVWLSTGIVPNAMELWKAESQMSQSLLIYMVMKNIRHIKRDPPELSLSLCPPPRSAHASMVLECIHEFKATVHLNEHFLAS